MRGWRFDVGLPRLVPIRPCLGLHVAIVREVEEVRLSRILVTAKTEQLAEPEIELVLPAVVISARRLERQSQRPRGGRRGHEIGNDELTRFAGADAVRRVGRCRPDVPVGAADGPIVALQRGVDLDVATESCTSLTA